MIPAKGERDCAHCGRTFTVPANNPHRRFCSPRCRVADWHARHDRPHQPDDDAPEANAVPNVVRPANAVPVVNDLHRCPHCHHELAVIAVVVPAAAAHTSVPEVSPMNLR